MMRVSESHAKTWKKKKKVHKYALLCCFLVAAVLIFCKTYELKNVTVSGNTRYSAEEIRQMLLTKPTDRITFLFWLRGSLQGFYDIPFIEKIELEMPDRHTALITVHEKRVIGCVEQMGSYLYFDKDGIVVESARERFEDVPLITGLKFFEIVLHEKIKVQREGMFEVILNLVRLIDKQDLTVSRIHFNADYEVTLYTQECEVLLGKKENYDEALAHLRSVLDSLQGRKLRIDMTDIDRIIGQNLENQELD